MSAAIEVRRNERGAWCVFVRGNFISDHATHAAARIAASQVAAEEERRRLECRTLDSKAVCVRCGAPDRHCWCEPVGPDGHWWVAPSVGANNTEYIVCQKCGNIQRADGKPSSACRGPVKVGLR